MDAETTTLLMIIAGALIALGGTGGLAIWLRPRVKRTARVFAAGLAAPLLACVLAVVGMFDAGSYVDGPPPGAVLLGGLAFAAALAPITLLVSGLAIRWSDRRVDAPVNLRDAQP